MRVLVLEPADVRQITLIVQWEVTEVEMEQHVMLSVHHVPMTFQLVCVLVLLIIIVLGCMTRVLEVITTVHVLERMGLGVLEPLLVVGIDLKLLVKLRLDVLGHQV